MAGLGQEQRGLHRTLSAVVTAGHPCEDIYPDSLAEVTSDVVNHS